MAASTYDEALRRLLAHEGGYSNHPADPGGPTNFGITLADVRRYVKTNATAQDVRALTVAQAKAIYRTRYWDALRGDALPAGVDYAVFDYGVNSGLARATRVLCALVECPQTTIDDAVLDAARARNAAALIDALCDERLAFLKRLKAWPVFGAGWSRRLAEVRTVALRLAAGKPAAAPAAAPSKGKGAISINTAAQKTSTGGVIATGTVAAQQAHSSGATVAVIATMVIVTLALALAAWLFWRWRQRRQQPTPQLPSARPRESGDPEPSRTGFPLARE